MSRFFFVVAMVLFFLEAVGAHPFQHLTTWGLVALSIGLALTGVPMPLPWKKT